MKIKWKNINNGRNRLAKSKKNQTAWRNENHKYLGILDADTIKQAEMKAKVREKYLRRTRKLLESKFCIRNLIKEINTLAFSLAIYSGQFLKWTSKKMDQMTRKMMMIDEALHQRDDIDHIYQPLCSGSI